MMRAGNPNFQFMGTSGGGAMYPNTMPMACYGGAPYPSPGMMMPPMQNMSYMSYPQPVMSTGQRPIINIIS